MGNLTWGSRNNLINFHMVSHADGDGDTACEKEIKQHYKIQGVIGKGTFATVRLGKHRETGQQVAVKIMSKRKMSKED